MTDYRHQRWDDEIEEQQRENRERFWREAAEADEYWRRVAAGEVDQPGDDDDECEIEDRGEDRSVVPGVPSSGGRPECDPGNEASGVAADGRVRPTHADDGRGLDGVRTDRELPAEGGGGQ